MNTKLGVFYNPFHVTEDFLLRERKRIEQMEVDHIEILLDHYKLLNASNKETLLLKSVVANWENIIHAPFVNISIVHPNEKLRLASVAVYKSVIEVARVLDSKLVTFHGGSYPFYIDDMNVIEGAFNASMTELVEAGIDNGISISIENLPRMMKTRIGYPSIFNEVKRMVSSMPQIKFTLDIGHVVENKEDILDYVKEFGQHISNVHIHDSDGKKSHLCIGKGNIDMGSVIKALNTLGVYLTLETVNDDDTYESFKIIKDML
ncbi:MAG: sugar phosphate isomerase/epimerase [Candidatus Aenigmarchaeota archaeon]|nr:sugar phosphate isomerase/epimerase [Candidatus Aenigmarchaeota archaeon]